MAHADAQVEHREGRVHTSDGLTLFEQSWAAGEPGAVVVLVHGYAEHSRRYEPTARRLARDGYAVQTLDLRVTAVPRGRVASSGPSRSI